MKMLIAVVTLVASFAVHAETTLVCTGSVGNGDFQINVEKDQNQNPVRVVVFNEAKKFTVFTTRQITAGMVNVGTPQEPFANYQISARKPQHALKLRFPEQDADEGSIFVEVKGTLPSVNFSSPAKEVEFECH